MELGSRTSVTGDHQQYPHEAQINQNTATKPREIARGTSNKNVSPDVARDAQLDAAAARPNNARANRAPDIPMPQASPEDVTMSSSSKSKILKFFFFPAEA